MSDNPNPTAAAASSPYGPTGPNPATIVIPPNYRGTINCTSYAANMQQVTVTWGSNTAVFTGNEEGKPMTLANGDQVAVISSSPTGYTMTVLCQWLNRGVGPNGQYTNSSVQLPIISTNGGNQFFAVTSEDGTDYDDNDAILTGVMSWVQPRS